jgi:hypothetical protein
MPDIYTIMLLDVAPKVAERFRADPKVAELVQPAVWIDANEEGCAAVIIERLEVIEALAPYESTNGRGVADPASEEAPITVVVVHHTGNPPGAQTFNVPDPRKHPDRWPWMGDVD